LSRKKYAKSEKRKITNKRYDQSPLGKKLHKDASKRYWDKYPGRRQARRAIEFAVKRGDLPRVSSVKCNYYMCERYAQEYHHHSYDEQFWLDVIPYCKQHHADVDWKR
jgi:hypothetical protein